jgi:cyclophilin family peptidyl-prolyl cis-trans isomerase
MKWYSILVVVLILTFFGSSKTLAQTNTEKKYELVQIETSFGNILIWLYDQTPKHKANFLKLTKEGFYNGTTFHRIIADFMIQGGDPNSKDNNASNDGIGGPGYTIDAEFVPTLSHDYGAVAAARLGDNVNPEKKSSGSQFYIVQNKNGTHFLDKSYTVFGKVVTGMSVVDTIAKQPKGQNDRPLQNITMQAKVVTFTAKELKDKYNFIVK